MRRTSDSPAEAPRRLARWLPWLALAAPLCLTAGAAAQSTRPVEGLREHTPRVHALVDARVVLEPGQVLDKATIVLRDGVIVAVGAEVAPPADSRVWNLQGKTIYAGLVDPYGEMPFTVDSALGAPSGNPQAVPQLSVAERYKPDLEINKKLRSQGIVARLVAPAGGILRGRSALVTTGDASDGGQAILREDVALHVRLTIPRAMGEGRRYPNSPMGAVALARQMFYDADWHARAWQAHLANRQLPRPDRNDALAALAPYSRGERPVIFETINEQFFLRADEFAREFGLQAVILGSGREYRRLDAVRQTGRTVIVPVNFPLAPDVSTLAAAQNATLESLMHWDHGPENPARLHQAGVTIALTAHGLKDAGAFLGAVRKAVERGLPTEAALRALTVTPAELVGASDRLGTIAVGKGGNLLVTDGDLFAKKTKVVDVWVDGARFEIQPADAPDIRGDWNFDLALADNQRQTLQAEIGGASGSPSVKLRPADAKPDEKTDVKASKVTVRDGLLNLSFEGERFGHKGPARLSAVISLPTKGAASGLGELVYADGVAAAVTARRTKAFDPAAKKEADKPDAKGADDPAKKSDDKPDEKPDENEAETQAEKPDEKQEEAAQKPEQKKPEPKASFPVNFPLGAFGRSGPPEQPKRLLITNATIWTCGPAGVLENASLLVGDGKILAVVSTLKRTKGAHVIDGTGLHLTPGIIDCHSHMATDGGINEGSQAITAEVRISDFLDANDVTIYRQLAGGVTAANILHGSANPIGGQNQVIKLRWGALPAELKFAGAPPGVKFALGENVKQSYLPSSSRYPQSRMGVEQIQRDAFAAAREYARRRDEWEQTRAGAPPRRDLELDALAEVLAGERWVHCHSYRQDEILTFIKLCDEYGVRIGTLQHILEGYKVADAMARHGAMGSSFADWWAYKMEVFDAIPYNGALMHRAGVVVSFNSDDREMGRRLNQEAGKAQKYGGVPAAEALKFVTLNAAKQLRIDGRVGSLEPGKDADFVLWSGPPLSPLARCEQTWVDGRRYFSREDDRQLRAERERMRTALIAKVLEQGAAMRAPGEADLTEADLWPREDTACHHDDEHE